MRKQNIRFQKSGSSGITLIALVVTIIVLMILAGVAVAALMGENGLITRSGEAKESQRGAAVQDEVKLAINENKMIDEINKTKGLTGGLKTKGELAEELVGKGYLTADEKAELETVDEITIGSVKIDFSGLAGDAGGGNNPQPGESGYAGGSYNNPYIPVGFTHTEGTWNAGYTITGNANGTNPGDQFVWVPCSTEETPPTGVVKFEKITTGKYNSDYLVLHPSGGTNGDVDDEDETVAEIRTSVGTYGGFYIAKYEAGITGTTDNDSLSTKTVTDGSVKPLSQSGVGVWNTITRTDCLTVSKEMIPEETGAKSTLISGECWDTALAWITATVDSTYAENSAGKGWFRDVSSNNIHTTGYYGGTNTNNIFDMGGNVQENTSENCLYEDPEDVYKKVVDRGGYYEGVGDYTPASSRGSNFGSSFGGTGFRVVLYK